MISKVNEKILKLIKLNAISTNLYKKILNFKRS